jgi:hypothetical protein
MRRCYKNATDESHNTCVITAENSGETVAGRIQNLRPWPKGISGDPAGRPKNISVEIARAVFENNREAVYRAMTRALCKGDARVFKVLADRAYGKVKECIEPLNANEAVLVEQFLARHRALQSLSDEELKEQIRQLQQELGIPTEPAALPSQGQ